MGGRPTGTVPGSFQRGGRKRGLQTDLQNEIVREIETLLGCQSIADLDFEAVEMAARRQALRLAARALEQRLNTDTSDHVGPQLPRPCGGSAQYHGRHGKTFESVLGPLHLQRAYYHCEVAPTMYLGMDGTGVPMRTQEVADRAGKQADGSAKTREAKLVTIWTAESFHPEGQPAPAPRYIT